MEQLETWVPKRIEFLCSKKRLSNYRLSELSKVSKGCLSQITNGKSLPSLKTLEALCQVMEITIAEFFDERHTPPLSAHDKRILKAFHGLGKQEQEYMLKILERADRGW